MNGYVKFPYLKLISKKMKINPKESIAGFPILKIRDLLRFHDQLTPEKVSKRLVISIEQANSVLQELIQLDYLELVPENFEYKTYTRTILGNALRMAKAIPSISKEKAKNLFDEFLCRVKEVNENDNFLWEVERVVVFGSFITDATFVNDIDLVVILTRRRILGNSWDKRNRDRINQAVAGGKHFYDSVDEMCYPELEVRKFLKGKSHYLSIVFREDEILKQTKSIQVFPEEQRNFAIAD